MTRMTETEANRVNKWVENGWKDVDEPESVLQGKIVAYCNGHGYPCLSFSQSRKARGFLRAGWCDITILLPKGRVVFLELKSAKGRLKPEQAELMQQAKYLQHEWHVVRTWKLFMEIIDGC